MWRWGERGFRRGSGTTGKRARGRRWLRALAAESRNQPQYAAGDHQQPYQNQSIPQTHAALGDLARVKWSGRHLLNFVLRRDLPLFRVGPRCELWQRSCWIHLAVQINGCNQPVAATKHARDIDRVLAVVSERSPQGRDGLINGRLRNDEVLPNRIEQLIDADDL